MMMRCYNVDGKKRESNRKKKETKRKKNIKMMNIRGKNVSICLPDFLIQGDNKSSAFYLLLNI